MPVDPSGRARVRALALMIACDGQPLLNLRVRQFLQSESKLTQEQRSEWMTHWMRLSLSEYDAALRDGRSGRFSHGDDPTLADVCLVPQVLMAQRFKVDVSDFPSTMRVFDAMVARSDVRAIIDEQRA